MVRAMLFSLTCLVFYFFCPVFAQESKKAQGDEGLPEQAKRLDIKKPNKSMKFQTVKSDKYKEEEYDIVVDEEEAKKTGYKPEELKRTLKDAMDARTDRREDSEITIEIEEDETKKVSDEEKEIIDEIEKVEVQKNPPDQEDECKDEKVEKVDKVDKEKKTSLVAKIKKKIKPKDAHRKDKSAEKKYDMGNGRSIKVNAGGACESQNKGLLDSVKFPTPA